jgi:hypothetical protein
MDMWSCVFVFEFGMLCPRVAESLPGAHGRSARCRLTRCSSCSSRVLASLLFDPFCPMLLVARGLSDDAFECGRSSPRGRSAGRARTIRFSRCSTGGLGGYFGRSAVNSRKVRYAPADSPPGPCGRSAPGTADCLSPLLLELHFRLLWVWVCS